MQLKKLSPELAYINLLMLSLWKAKRIEILLRDGNKCRACGDNKFLQIHHRQYHVLKATGKFKDPWRYEKAQLITLCKRCHEEGHGSYKIPLFIVNK